LVKPPQSTTATKVRSRSRSNAMVIAFSNDRYFDI
jgi:hypothetical protein